MQPRSSGRSPAFRAGRFALALHEALFLAAVEKPEPPAPQEKKEPDKFKALSSFRDDLYNPVAKDSPEYGVKILPPDFLLNPVRSIKDD